MTKVENPSAFPVSTIDGKTNCGMDLRDYFAGQVAQGIIANSENVASGAEPTNSALSGTPFHQWIASTSYGVADAMLAERAKGPA
jgi:hypothetical protein